MYFNPLLVRLSWWCYSRCTLIHWLLGCIGDVTVDVLQSISAKVPPQRQVSASPQQVTLEVSRPESSAPSTAPGVFLPHGAPHRSSSSPAVPSTTAGVSLPAGFVETRGQERYDRVSDITIKPLYNTNIFLPNPPEQHSIRLPVRAKYGVWLCGEFMVMCILHLP